MDFENLNWFVFGLVLILKTKSVCFWFSLNNDKLNTGWFGLVVDHIWFIFFWFGLVCWKEMFWILASIHFWYSFNDEKLNPVWYDLELNHIQPVLFIGRSIEASRYLFHNPPKMDLNSIFLGLFILILSRYFHKLILYQIMISLDFAKVFNMTSYNNMLD